MTLDEARAELRRLERMVQHQRTVVAVIEQREAKERLLVPLGQGPLLAEPPRPTPPEWFRAAYVAHLPPPTYWFETPAS